MFFFFKQKTAYEMRISDWSSDVCSSDLPAAHIARDQPRVTRQRADDSAMFAMRAHRADDRLGAQAGQSTICVWVTSATSRSAEGRVGKGWVRKGRSRGSPANKKKNSIKTNETKRLRTR